MATVKVVIAILLSSSGNQNLYGLLALKKEKSSNFSIDDCCSCDGSTRSESRPRTPEWFLPSVLLLVPQLLMDAAKYLFAFGNIATPNLRRQLMQLLWSSAEDGDDCLFLLAPLRLTA